MRRKRAFFATAVALATLLLALGAGAKGAGIYAERYAAAKHARELGIELRRSEVFADLPSRSELTAAAAEDHRSGQVLSVAVGK